MESNICPHLQDSFPMYSRIDWSLLFQNIWWFGELGSSPPHQYGWFKWKWPNELCHRFDNFSYVIIELKFSEETLNQVHVYQCFTLDTLKNQMDHTSVQLYLPFLFFFPLWPLTENDIKPKSIQIKSIWTFISTVILGYEHNCSVKDYINIIISL